MKIAVVDDEPISARIVAEFLRSRLQYDVTIAESGEEFLSSLLPAGDIDIVLLDIMLPGKNGLEVLEEIQKLGEAAPAVIILSAQDKAATAVTALQNGARDYFTKPVDLHRLEHAMKNIGEMKRLHAEVEHLRHQIRKEVYYEEIIAGSDEMREVFHVISKVKDTNVPVMILGESGTGKELVARAIHYYGNRAKGPFVAVNCAAIPADLLESELFGHERGAFTGAVGRTIGTFEQANGGTLFLDEIAELGVNLQSKLLRVLQTRSFERVGGTETIPVDVRIVSATNADLIAEQSKKRFRQDLYFRLSTFPIIVPPLRKRKGDILLLADAFLKKYSAEYKKPGLRFDKSVLHIFGEYNWPGNVRELENIVQRAILMTESSTITPDDIPNLSPLPLNSTDSLDPFFASLPQLPTMEEIRQTLLKQLLLREKGNISAVAKHLGIGRATLYRMMKRYRLS